MEKEKAEVFPRSPLMTDETEKNPEDTGTTHTPSVLDEIAAEEAQSPPDDKEQAAPEPQDSPADAATDEIEQQDAEAVPEENLEDQYKTLQEKIAEADRLLSKVQSSQQEKTAPADAAQSEEKSEAPEQTETVPGPTVESDRADKVVQDSRSPDEAALATDIEETADTTPPPLATTAEETPQTPPDEPPAEEAALAESPEDAQEEAKSDAHLKTKLFQILDGASPEPEVTSEAPAETATEEVQDSEPPEKAEETSEPPAESATSAEKPPESAAETSDESAAKASDKPAAETPIEATEKTTDKAAPPTTEPEEAPPPSEAAASEEKTAPAEAPPETTGESGAGAEPAPPPASGAAPADSPPASGTEAFSIQMPDVEPTAPGQAAPPFSPKMLLRPGELMTFFERTLEENENVRTAWLVFGCISLGVAGLALLMWLFSSM